VNSNVYWIEAPGSGRIGIMARPRGDDWLEYEIRALKNGGVDVLVSLLTAEENFELRLVEEPSICGANGIEFRSLPVVDRSVPAWSDDFRSALTDLGRRYADGESIVAHCRQGIGRASIVAALLLIRCGLSVDEAFRRIEAARGCQVPDTPEQQEWAQSIAESEVLKT
jgi:protein-tyrosine phosphatase